MGSPPCPKNVVDAKTSKLSVSTLTTTNRDCGSVLGAAVNCAGICAIQCFEAEDCGDECMVFSYKPSAISTILTNCNDCSVGSGVPPPFN